MKKQNNLVNLALASMFLALAFVMPFLTGQVPQIGSMLCPMHIPVILCGFFCGWQWGIAVGITAPLLRSLMLGMPPLFPTAVCMAFELAAYAVVAALMHKHLPRKRPFVYLSLITAMLAGRVVWGAAMLVCMGLSGGTFTLGAFVAGAFVNAVPGIIVQLVLIPVLVMTLDRRYRRL